MGSMSPMHWLIVLVIVVLVFGTGKLKNFGKDLGGAIKGFKDSMKEGEAETSAETEPAKLPSATSAKKTAVRAKRSSKAKV